jgi:hypothetical protein
MSVCAGFISEQQYPKKMLPIREEEEKMDEKDVGEALVKVIRDPQGSASQESFARAMELTRAYAGSGSATHFSAVARLFYDLFEMFETGADPRKK